MMMVFGLISNGLYLDLDSKIWLMTTGVENKISLIYQDVLFITLFKEILKSSSSVYSFSPFFASGVMNSTIGDFI
jgi:hypothetical protein